jgi:hypothetical protein
MHDVKDGWKYSTYGRSGEMHIVLWYGNLTERDSLEDLGADGRITLKWIFKNWHGGLDLIDLA